MCITLNGIKLIVKFEMDMYNISSQHPTECKGLCLLIHKIKVQQQKLKKIELQQKQQFHTVMWYILTNSTIFKENGYDGETFGIEIS